LKTFRIKGTSSGFGFLEKNKIQRISGFHKKNQQAKNQRFRPGSLTQFFKKLGNPVKGQKPVSAMIFENQQSRVRTGSLIF
jgi:hypothetical protein